ncbi:hypothetical protein SAMN05421799_108164 [Alicyclobacillus vulcanalis]|uniref:Uncharacterized protein n=2 Tax=Alicyclobacillus vulcanalis TaxID=252246 RepID=A0A1N7NJ67_9BACL|nr:hypothetical protein SAMN05421799_108164 [Alicyclobacillus vulcanalis]
MMHPILYGVKEFAADEKMWAVVGKTYQELGGGIVSVANRLYEGNNRLNDK